ncbi:MAG: bifunctional folylpolyglutamate synthase/dihydrofolate synthase [Planctomycetota bacterium]|jgi:dihydrofolate synthase/folylpolyglutamate synthase
MNRLETLWTELCGRTDYESCSRPRAARFRLDTIQGLVERLGNVHRAMPALHVAGSKGKGSVCAYLGKGLTASGVRSGVYSSPHLSDWRERIQVDGHFLEDDAYASAIEVVLAVSIGDETFFDLLTAVALVAFRDAGCEIVVLETGLGGRSDSTNVVVPLAAAISSIELEHVDVLGEDLATIAGEKAGIFKSESLLFAGAGLPPAALSVLEQTAEELDQSLVVAPSSIPGFRHPQPHMQANFALAVTILRSLPRPFAAAADVLLTLPPAALQLPGRWEHRRLADGRPVVLDVAHSTSSLTSVLDHFRDAFPELSRGVVLALRDDKDAEQLAAELDHHLGPRPASESWWTAPAGDHPRSADPDTIALCFDAVALPEPGFPDGPEVLLITGSTYLVGALRPQTTPLEA